MDQGQRQYELVLLGATGYTGKLTAEWIGQHLPTDLTWAIAGRNTTKLQSLVKELNTLSPDRKQPDVETCTLDPTALTALASKTHLLISTIGPFTLYGEPAFAACARTGTHYLDSTGEIPWIKRMLEKYSSLAQTTGAIMIPQCGLDSVPADMLTYMLTRHVRQTLGTGTATVDVSLLDAKTGISGGTSETMLTLFEHFGARKLGEGMEPWSIAPERPVAPAKSPRGGWLYRVLGMAHIPELGGLQTMWLMATVDRCIAHRSWGLYQERAKKTGNADLSYGPRFNYHETMRAKSFLHGAAISLGMALFGLLLALPPSRWLLAPLIRRLAIPKPGEGPSRESMKGDFMNYRGLAIADTPQKQKVLGEVCLSGGGYVTTGQTLSAAAMLILRGRIGETEAAKMGGGILTSAMLGELYVEELHKVGIDIRVGI